MEEELKSHKGNNDIIWQWQNPHERRRRAKHNTVEWRRKPEPEANLSSPDNGQTDTLREFLLIISGEERFSSYSSGSL